MTRTPKKPVRQQAILTKLREGIVRGALPPGARLSTRLQLAEQFDTTVITVQRALTKLSQEGFVTASGSRGTFVSENPPHLSHYGLVFGYRPQDPAGWLGMTRAMRDAAFALERSESRQLSLYFYSGYAPHKQDDFQRLLNGVASHTLAGLIFVESPHRLVDSPIITQPGIPRIGIMSESVIPGVAAVYVDQRGFFDRALDYLHARGRRRVALIAREFPESLNDHIRAAVAQRGMELPPYAWQSANVDGGSWARNAAHLLLRQDQQDRPDGLIIAEDVFVDTACAGIAASGAAVGRDVDVVAHCNYPNVPAKVLPIRLLGFDSDQLLRSCIDYVDRTRRGELTKNVTMIPALFEDELSTRKTETNHLAALLAT